MELPTIHFQSIQIVNFLKQTKEVVKAFFKQYSRSVFVRHGFILIPPLAGERTPPTATVRQ